jgi:preprotein translocase SecF subunit
LIALLLANLGILIYISFRFEWKFGIAAIAALIHDVLIMLVVYSIAQIAINASFIAAILTIVGYSINDTIVVFDRIRENKKHTKKIDYNDLVNRSISETMVRSINTSLTTLVTILALYILGVPAIKDFALPLVVGIIAGTYSSIFIASPLWVLLDQKLKTGGAH